MHFHFSLSLSLLSLSLTHIQTHRHTQRHTRLSLSLSRHLNFGVLILVSLCVLIELEFESIDPLYRFMAEDVEVHEILQMLCRSCDRHCEDRELRNGVNQLLRVCVSVLECRRWKTSRGSRYIYILISFVWIRSGNGIWEGWM